jgi:organic hydroperoxide reductase OsmC/OhrA
MIDHADYQVTIDRTGLAQGLATSLASGLPSLAVASPPEFGGPAGEWSPEHLLVAAVGSCFLTTFLAIADASRLEVAALSVPGEGTIERGEDRRYRFTRIVLGPHIALVHESDRDRAQRIVQKAEGACLVTRSLGTPVTVEPVIEVQQAAGATISS